MSSKKYICPVCKQRTGVNILYGMPTPEAFEMAERQEIALGGCCIGWEDTERQCLSCGHEWRIRRRKVEIENYILY
ncbi:hypothetical protein [Synechococcus elongatus]|uniref:hypothetical protein n=1 Tax=Synechococcus elongatus TaxID=32046 RepID=UPI000F7F44BD|nr:hypothetical protein [Synechococcus elongatus]